MNNRSSLQNINRRSFLRTTGIATALPFFSTVFSQEHKLSLPNIIFILVDDMRWDQLSLMGHPFIKTPNIDRIGKEGVLFENAYVCTPLCSPSRASFLTGQYPHKHRIINNDRNGLASISHKLVTFPQALRRNGYETAFIGKWHMGNDDSRRPGFDEWFSFRGQGLFIDPVVNDNGQRKQKTGYMTDILNQKALDFVNKKHDKPFLLYLSHKAVHGPFIPAKRHEQLYGGEKYTLPKSAKNNLEGKPALTRKVDPVEIVRVANATPEPMEPRYGRGREKENIYLDHARCLASVDEGVGQLMGSLKESGELDNTLIIFASDNGFLFGEHGQFMNKRVAYEESLRIPLLMRYPKLISQGSKQKQPVLNIDIAPTLYEMAGVNPPVKMHGKSLLSIFKNLDEKFRNGFLAEYFLERVTPLHAEWQAVRTDRWKYIHYTELEGMDELYDLHNDPIEMENVIYSQQNVMVIKDMKKRLSQLLTESEAM
jgi:N-acetylglucosamine-6-sulfatase